MNKSGCDLHYKKSIKPKELDLIHDQIREINNDGVLICWHCAKTPDEIWGRTRQEAFERLKIELNKWGELQ